MPLSYIRQQGQQVGLGSTVIAVVAEGPSGRIYAAPHSSKMEIVEAPDLDLGPIPENPRDFKTPNYGMTNWQEYLAGTDPHDSKDFLRFEGVSISNQICLLQFNTCTGRT